MPLTLAQMQALFPDNTAGDISAEDGRDVIEGLFHHGTGALGQRGDLSSAHADDDEFNVDGSGAPAGWTFVQDATPRTTLATRFGRLHFYHTGDLSSAREMEGIIKAVPSGPPLTIETCLRPTPEALPAAPMIGMVFMNSDGPTWSTGDGLFAGVFNSAQNYNVDVRTITNWVIASTNTASEQQPDSLFPLHMRLIWEAANTFTVSLSPDGVAWKHWDSYESSTAVTLTPAFMGLGWTPFNDNATIPWSGYYEYFRVYEEAKGQGIV